MNSPALNRKISADSARPAQLAASDMTNEQIVQAVFLRVYCRQPTAEEAEKALASLTSNSDRRTGVEDLFWALLNTPEFLFID